MGVKYAILFLSICLHTQADLKSPCPNVFNYQQRDDSTDRWYGLFNLASHEETVGVQLKLTLDKPALQIVNLLGNATTSDRKQFTITNRYFKLTPNSPHLLRFYVAYDPNKIAPALINIEQNDRRICPDPGPSSHKEVFYSIVVNPQPELRLPYLDDAPVEESVVEDECGIITAEASPLIVGGEVPKAGAFPWHVAIYNTKYGKLKIDCGGSLVSKQIVVTTTSCLFLDQPDVNDIEVHLGKQYLDEITTKVQIRQISERIAHPMYNQSSKIFNHNIGLLKLKEPATFSDFVKPVCLNPPDVDNLIDRIGTVPGWGNTETRTNSEKLRYAAMKVVSDEACLSKNSWYYLIRGSFCAETVNGSTPCTGDYGGGLVFPDESNGRIIYQLRGIFAYGSSMCGDLKYQVFTDVIVYLNFIKANL